MWAQAAQADCIWELNFLGKDSFTGFHPVRIMQTLQIETESFNLVTILNFKKLLLNLS